MSSLSCDIKLCEETDWPFGTRGTCDNVTNICLCPEGYSGRDFWEQFNFCHLADNLRADLARVALVSTLLSMGVLLAMLIQMAERIEKTKRSHKRMGFGQAMSFASGLTLGNKHSSINLTLQRQPKKKDALNHLLLRDRKVVAVLCIFLLSMVLSLPFKAGLMLRPPAFVYTTTFYLAGTYALSLGTMFLAMIALVQIYFKTMPNLTAIGKFIGMQSIVVTRPNFIYRLTLSLVVAVIACFLFIWILPEAIPNIYETSGGVLADARVASLGLLSLFISATIAKVCHEVIKIFKKAIGVAKFSGSGANGIQTPKLNRALQNMRYVIFLVYSGAGLYGLYIFMLTSSSHQVMALCWTFLFVCVDLSAVIFGVLLMRELTTAHEMEARKISSVLGRREESEKSTDSLI